MPVENASAPATGTFTICRRLGVDGALSGGLTAVPSPRDPPLVSRKRGLISSQKSKEGIKESCFFVRESSYSSGGTTISSPPVSSCLGGGGCLRGR